MTNPAVESPPTIVRHPRLVAALLLGVAVPTLMGANAVLGRLIVPDDPMATASNVMKSEALFRFAAFAVVAVLTASLFVLMQLYWLLRPVGRNLAALMVVLYLVGVCLALSTEVHRLALPFLLDEGAVGESPGQLDALISVSMGLHATGSLIAGIFWGLWLIPYGYLVLTSGFFPRFFGLLLIVECFAFLFQSIAGLFAPALEEPLAVVVGITTLAELLVPLWILIKGGDVALWWQRRVRGSAWSPTSEPATT